MSGHHLVGHVADKSHQPLDGAQVGINGLTRLQMSVIQLIHCGIRSHGKGAVQLVTDDHCVSLLGRREAGPNFVRLVTQSRRQNSGQGNASESAQLRRLLQLFDDITGTVILGYCTQIESRRRKLGLGFRGIGTDRRGTTLLVHVRHIHSH